MGLNTNNIKAPESNSKFPPAEALEPDSYPARVVQVIDLGIQPQRPFQGQEKPPAHEIMVTYELGTEFLKDEDGEDDETKPRWVSESFPIYSLEVDRAKSSKRYLAIDPKKKAGGDFGALAGFPCTVTLNQYVNKKSGKTNNGVTLVGPIMKGFNPPELVNEPKVFSLDEPDLDVFRSLPEWLQEKIKGNGEYRGSLLEQLLAGGTTDAPKEEKKAAPAKKAAPKPEPQAEESEEEGDEPW